MYETFPWTGGEGVYMRTSTNLEQWTEKRLVTDLPDGLVKSAKAWWAPELHAYKGKYYLFVTLWRPEHKPSRGTWAFRSDSPDGPFRKISDNALTPCDWDSLDGTLWVENGRPYLVFSHNWNQTGTGTMNLVELTDDLSSAKGEARELFKGTDYTDKPTFVANEPYVDHVAEGPFVFRSSATGKLHMLWSNLIPSGYADFICESKSGSLAGPWSGHRVLYGKDGGHGMIFRDLKGRILLSLHHPNGSPNERMHCFELTDTAEGVVLRGEVTQ